MEGPIVFKDPKVHWVPRSLKRTTSLAIKYKTYKKREKIIKSPLNMSHSFSILEISRCYKENKRTHFEPSLMNNFTLALNLYSEMELRRWQGGTCHSWSKIYIFLYCKNCVVLQNVYIIFDSIKHVDEWFIDENVKKLVLNMLMDD